MKIYNKKRNQANIILLKAGSFDGLKTIFRMIQFLSNINKLQKVHLKSLTINIKYNT